LLTTIRVNPKTSIQPQLSRFIFELGIVIAFFICVVFIKPVKADEGKIVFNNFSKQIVLLSKGDSFQLKGTNTHVQLTNRIIVKALTGINKQELLSLHKDISKVTELFQGTTSSFFSLELNSQTNLTKVLIDLQDIQINHPDKGIMLVQPDMLQLTNKTEISVANSAAIKEDLSAIKASLKKKQPNSASNSQSPYLKLLNIPIFWQQGKGENIRVAIIDDGINLEHSELKHIKTIFSYDVENKVMSSMPIIANDTHGTKVAGIIFSAHDNVGIDGIAPAAELISIRQPSTWTSNTLLSFQLANLTGAQIINCSWHSQLLLQPIADIIDDLAENGRQGKGIAVVISAGNTGKKIVSNSTEASIESAFVVGANGYDFQRLPFSNYGQAVDFYTFGKRVKTTLSSGGYGTFSGTSLAAAIVSGVSALLLSHRPELTIAQLSQQLELITETEK
jgi:subtilisin family serine protease